MKDNPSVPLEGVNKTVGTVEVVGGPRPYLWLGNEQGVCIGVVSDRHLRRLRDGITKALRRGQT